MLSGIKKIPYQAPPTQLGPQNVHFRKWHFWDPNINVRIFIFFGKFKELPGATFLYFPLGYLKTAQKTVQSSKNTEK